MEKLKKGPSLVNNNHASAQKLVVKTIILKQDPPNHKISGDLCLHVPSSTSKGGVFIA